MEFLLTAIFLVLSLVCGVQGQAECVQEEYEDFWQGGSGSLFCGCQLQDSSDNPLFNISLDFFDTHTVSGEDVEYTYSPCSGNTSCEDTAAVCRHVRIPRSYKSIGLLDNVNYTVNNLTFVNISATYYGGEDGTSVVYLVCDKTVEDEGTFTFVRRDKAKKIYYFQLSYAGFCLPPMPTTTTKTPTKTTTTKTMTTTTTTKTMTTTSSSKMPTTTTNPPTNKPSENKEDKDRKVVLGIVLSIVGAIIVGVILAIVVYFVWKKKRGASYEKIPTM